MAAGFSPACHPALGVAVPAVPVFGPGVRLGVFAGSGGSGRGWTFLKRAGPVAFVLGAGRRIMGAFWRDEGLVLVLVWAVELF